MQLKSIHKMAIDNIFYSCNVLNTNSEYLLLIDEGLKQTYVID